MSARRRPIRLARLSELASANAFGNSGQRFMPLKPWYKVVTPREDLREGKPLDASEFAVRLDDVRNRSAPADYQEPDRFFARTYLTKNLSTLASQVMRRLSGERTETRAVFNLATRFGGGKTVRERIHGAMILLAAGRGEALKRFLVEDGAGNEQRFWRLAQALSALYPASTEEKRWVDGVMAGTKTGGKLHSGLGRGK